MFPSASWCVLLLPQIYTSLISVIEAVDVEGVEEIPEVRLLLMVSGVSDETGVKRR